MIIDFKKYYKKYRQLHKKERNEYNKEYRKKHKKELKDYNRKYKLSHKEYIKNYNLKNQKKIRLQKKKYRNKYKCRLFIENRLRVRVYHALKNNIKKATNTVKLLGCSLDVFRKYLESKFKPGMNWKNYGKWQIDHIKPCNKFDLSKASEQFKCFNYKNLRPLWAKENLSRNKK
jgi:hypothetical protein